MPYSWSQGVPERIVRRIEADRPTYFISDVHLGDGSHSDSFMHKDRALLRLIEAVRGERGRLVINGDAIDFHQSADFTRIVRAHGKLLRALSELADTNGVIYLCGNHDDDIQVYRDILRFDVCTELWVGTDVMVCHGHIFDPYIGPHLAHSHKATRMHHWLERQLHLFLRVPVADFYNWGLRIGLWTTHKLWLAVKLRNFFLRKLGFDELAKKSELLFHHWTRSEAGDPVGMTRPALRFAKERGLKAVICGHSHMPGNVLHDGVRYVNSGSWTFGWAQYIRYAEGEFTVRDWLTGREYRDELYRPLLDGDLDRLDFERWWRNQYLGWFRFRTGELKRLYGTTT